ncbi:ATP synthase subunit C [Desulfogranum mediterraneum]|uniref:ATP synthase subunit C n=1 Tax=Desulfogranum mediterraneum TaxID=160661 RepID=UPI0003FFEFAF|nr:ATP synthase subunit C [Desulfogranum mediterraneum]
MHVKGCRIWLTQLFLLLLPTIGLAQETVATAGGSSEAAKWGYMAAAVAVGASSLGAGIAVALVGSAAMGALSERPELAGRALIFLGLAEGIAIYGLIVAIMILAKI